MTRKPIPSTSLLPVLLLFLLVACGGDAPGGASATGQPTVATEVTTAPDLPAIDPEALAGEYQVTGTTPDGAAREGTLEIAPQGEGFELRWATGPSQVGTGLVEGDLLAAGWGGEDCSVAIYRAEEDGSLKGRWKVLGGEGIGLEEATPLGQGTGLPGAYDVIGYSPNGTTYTGTLTLSEQGDLFNVDWRIEEFAFTGVGIQRDGLLAVGWGDASCGVSAYQPGANGGLEGVWGERDKPRLGTESATRP